MSQGQWAVGRAVEPPTECKKRPSKVKKSQDLPKKSVKKAKKKAK